MEQNASLEIQGIQCDSCDWQDLSIVLDDYAEWVNKPCPKCGANLLTEEDYRSVMALKSATNFLNTMSQDDIEKFEADFIKNASEEQMNNVIEMMKGLGNMVDDAEVGEGMTIDVNIGKDGKIEFNKSDDE